MIAILIIMSSFGGNYAEYQHFGDELPIIRAAAERNSIVYGSDDWYMLLAIRKAEGGRSGREFGILHPRAINTNLDTQAGWCSATIVKNRVRWEKAGKPDTFIRFIAGRYCPESVDPIGYINWIKNVGHWKDRLQYGAK